MISERTEPIERILAVVLYLFLAVLIFFSAYQLQHSDSDIFWALASGEWILSNMAVPHTDPFSYTFAGRPWVDFTWGFQVVSHLFYTYLGGWSGLFILQLALTAVTFCVAGLNLRLLTSKRVWLAAVLLFILFTSSYMRLFIRPHLFSYLFISIFILFLNIHERRSGGRGGFAWALYALLPLQVLWVNIHSSAILGVFIVGAYAAGGVIDALLFRTLLLGREKVSALKRLVAVSVLIPIVSVLNPYGVKLVLFPFAHQGGVNADALRHIGEWTRISLPELLLYFLPNPINFTAFRVAFFVSVIAILMNWRRLRTRDIILIAGAFYMAASHVRWVSQFAFFGVPIAAANLAAYFDARRESRGIGYNSNVESLFKISGFLLSILLIVCLIPMFFGYDARSNYGIGIRTGHFPEGNVAFMEREGIDGNIFNEYIYGGFLIFNRPGQKVFIDGRTPTVYSPSFFWSMRTSVDSKSWNRLVAEHGIEAALVSLKDTKRCSMLHESEEWEAVNFDEVSLLYLRTSEANKGAIERYAFKSFDPCERGIGFTPPDDEVELLAMKQELEAFLLREGADGLAKAQHTLAQIDTELGGVYLESAPQRLEKAIRIIDSPYVRYDYGVALSHLKRDKEAVEQFKEALDRKPYFKEAMLGLALAQYELKEYDTAIEWFKKYLVIADDTAVHIAYKMLGLTAIELNMHATAIDALERAAFGTDDPTALADIYYRLGNLFFETAEYTDGIGAYVKAIEVEPEYTEVLKQLASSHEDGGRVKEAAAIRALLERTLEKGSNNGL